MKADEINIRDPFILVENQAYYMYGTRGETAWSNGKGFDVYKSNDLVEWEGPVQVFDSAAYGLDRGVNWAPEVHKYKNGYYMFATFLQENGHIGTYILYSGTPEGPFMPHSQGTVTPKEWKSLDGTFYLDRQGKPYLIFCHEWTQIQNGTICAVRLSEDLSKAEGEPILLWKGSDLPGAEKKSDYVTDGPYLFRLKNGSLLCMWSSSIHNTYVQAAAISKSGEIHGSWVQLPELLYTADGGHGMLFNALDGRLLMTLHSPNTTLEEHPVFIELEETENGLAVVS